MPSLTRKLANEWRRSCKRTSRRPALRRIRDHGKCNDAEGRPVIGETPQANDTLSDAAEVMIGKLMLPATKDSRAVLGWSRTELAKRYRGQPTGHLLAGLSERVRPKAAHVGSAVSRKASAKPATS